MRRVRVGVTLDEFPVGTKVKYHDDGISGSRNDGKTRVYVGRVQKALGKGWLLMEVHTVNNLRCHTFGVFSIRADGHYRLNGDSSRKGPILERANEMRQALTGWMFTDATRQVQCPKCGQPAGQSCRTPKGRLTKGHIPHGERISAMYAAGVPKEAHIVNPGENRQAKLADINEQWTKEN